MELIEIGTIDLRFAHTRHHDAAVEKRLLASIQERDILDPLMVVRDTGGEQCVLVDGFKRYRCARKLGATLVPVDYIGDDVISGLLALLRRGETRGPSTMEQAALIEELHEHYSMSIYDIAVSLDRSPSWVSMRLGMLSDLSLLVREKIMSGAFPARAYLYGLKGFTRVNKIPMEDVDACVKALSGKHLSTRDLFVLSHAYFDGGESMKRLIIDGDVHRALRIVKGDTGTQDWDMSAKERTFLEDLTAVSTNIKRLLYNAGEIREMTVDFTNHVNLYCAVIMQTMSSFQTLIEGFYERTRPAVGSTGVVSAGTRQEDDRAVASS